MDKRSIGALILTLCSLGLLIPGLILPILSIDIGAKIPILGELSLHNTKQSIVETIMSLWKNGNAFVAILILLFSVAIPFIKACAMLIAILVKDENMRVRINHVLGLIGKWSMADVFIVAIFIAFLSTSSEDNIQASIHSGFYYFLSYCILSILAFQLFKISSSINPS